MIRNALLASTVLALVGTTAIAAANSGISFSKDGSVAMAAGAPATYWPSTEAPSGLVTIFSNMGKKYPKAIYFSGSGFAIYGPNNTQGSHELWDAEAFTPNGNHTITRIQFAANSYIGTNKIVVGIYSDVGGVPGVPLKTWTVSGLPPFPSCCAIQGKSTAGIPVTDGTQYWFVIKTDSSDPDAGVIWNYNTTNVIDSIPLAQYCSSDAGGSTCGAYNDVWRNVGGISPQMAFAILGSD